MFVFNFLLVMFFNIAMHFDFSHVSIVIVHVKY